MKKQVKNFAWALVAGLFTFSSVSASVVPTEKNTFDVGLVTVKEGIKVNLMISKPGSNWVSIYLKNDKNEVLYSENMLKKEKQFAKTFNLADIEDGKYRFVITDGRNTV